MSAHRLPTGRFRRTALVVGTLVAVTAGSLAAALPATATAPAPNPVTKLVASLEAQIAAAENNPQLEANLGLLENELYQVQWFIQSDCAVNIVMALMGDWYGPVCPGSSL
jgi:hypothetical protein